MVHKSLKSSGPHLFGINLKASTWLNSRIIRRNQYSTSNIMLLSTPRSFPSLPYMGSLWRAWIPLRTHLLFSLGDSSIPGHWSIIDTLRCSKGLQSLSESTYQEMASMWGRIGACNIRDLWSAPTQSWINVVDRTTRLRLVDTNIINLNLQFFNSIRQARIDQLHGLPTASIWCWSHRDKPITSFSINNTRRYALLRPKGSDSTRLNRIWSCSLTKEEWTGVWSNLVFLYFFQG